MGGKPDFGDPVVLSADRGGTSVEALCAQIHKSLVADFSYALVWGTSSKHYPQRCAGPLRGCKLGIPVPPLAFLLALLA